MMLQNPPKGQNIDANNNIQLGRVMPTTTALMAMRKTGKKYVRIYAKIYRMECTRDCIARDWVLAALS